MIVLVAGVPALPFLVGVILTSHVPACFRRIVQVAVCVWAFLSVVILQLPRAARVARVSRCRVALRVAVIA